MLASFPGHGSSKVMYAVRKQRRRQPGDEASTSTHTMLDNKVMSTGFR